jgi:hypothetical protein
MGCRSNWYANDEIRKISSVTRFPFSDFPVPCKRQGSGTLSTEPLYSLHLVSRDIVLGPKSFYTTVFPVCRYGFTSMPDWRRRLIGTGVGSSNERFAKGEHRDSDPNDPILLNDVCRDFVGWNSDNFKLARSVHVLLSGERIDTVDHCFQLPLSGVLDARIYSEK